MQAEKAAADERSLRRLLEEAGARESAPPEELEAIRAAALSTWEQVVRSRRRRRRMRWLAAFAAALTAATGIALWWEEREPAAPQAVARVVARGGEVLEISAEGGRVPAGGSVEAGTVVETAAATSPRAGRASLRLAGGAVVRVDAGTRLRLASAGRLELERGAVYADSGPGPDAAGLRIETPLGTARDVGTQFEVRLGPGAGVTVRVREGRVELDRDGRTLVAAAGRQLVVHADGSREESALAPWSEVWHWTLEAAPPFDIEGRSLGELLDAAARESGWTVRFAPPALEAEARRIVLHGSTGDLTVDRAALAVLPGAGLSGSVESGILTVRRGASELPADAD